MITMDLFEGQLTADVVQEILLQQAADVSPIYSFLLAAGQTLVTNNNEIKWYTSVLSSRRTAINNAGEAYTAATTSLVVDNASIFTPNALILAEATGEIMLCAAVNAGTNTITVVRGIGSVVAAAAGSVADDAALTFVGYAAGEAGTSPAALVRARTPVVNYTQHFRRSIELSGRILAENLDTGRNVRIEERQEKFVEIGKDIEYALLFGAAKADAVDGEGRRVSTTGGLHQAIATHVDNVGGTMTLKRFHQFTEEAFDEGSGEKVMWCGPTVLTSITELYAGKLAVENLADAAGIRIQRVITPHGSLMLQPHKLLRGAYAGTAVVVDPASVRLRPMAGERGPLHLVQDIQQPGQDAVKDEWTADLSLEWGDETRHAVLEGVTVS